ncbi:EVE domain-containing protein [Compostimonas suwonensis]|uniref:UPF0310 protein CLV54_0711 n=1 Tax=Compostimonas suwonensis TaxID=1048394 RepID=A0A2M9C569_9MICO|nr:EVE domain-containing protein [Compostimonas suwonensis]PJJ65674.1 EVE domain-containing protein [Compostimonas suwonensis]
MAIRYWLGVVHRDHVERAARLGFAQLNHGSRSAVAGLSESDGLVYYSPRASVASEEPLRAFTAIGRVEPGEIWQAEEGSFRPWRRRVDYFDDAVEAPIRPLVPLLDLTRDNPHWGYQLRRGLLPLTRHDFELIRQQMRRPSADDRR